MLRGVSSPRDGAGAAPSSPSSPMVARGRSVAMFLMATAMACWMVLTLTSTTTSTSTSYGLTPLQRVASPIAPLPAASSLASSPSAVVPGGSMPGVHAASRLLQQEPLSEGRRLELEASRRLQAAQPPPAWGAPATTPAPAAPQPTFQPPAWQQQQPQAASSPMTLAQPGAPGPLSPSSALPDWLPSHIPKPAYFPSEEHKIFSLKNPGVQPLDLVYTYVNRSFTRELETVFQSEHKNNSGISPDSVLPHMYRDRGELCFSLRSIDQFFPDFEGQVHIVTNTIPEWLNLNNPRVKIVREDQIMPAEDLPTFNSMALEANLHTIPNLSDYYLYLNDDFMLGREVSYADFVAPHSGCHQFYHLPLDIEGKNGRKARLKHPHGHALLNAHKLIDRVFPDGIRYPRYDLAHIPHFFHRKLAEHVSATFDKELKQQSKHKFRTVEDIHFAHLYAYYTRELPINATSHARGWCADMRVVLPNCRPGYDYCFGVKPNATDIARELHALRERAPALPKFLNLNDKNPTAEGARQAQRVTTHFLEQLYPKPSQYESYDCMVHYRQEELATDPPIDSFLVLTDDLRRLEADKLIKKREEVLKDIAESLIWRDIEAAAEMEAIRRKELGLPPLPPTLPPGSKAKKPIWAQPRYQPQWSPTQLQQLQQIAKFGARTQAPPPQPLEQQPRPASPAVNDGGLSASRVQPKASATPTVRPGPVLRDPTQQPPPRVAPKPGKLG